MSTFPKLDDIKLNETILKISQRSNAFIDLAKDNTICQAGEDKYGNYRGFCLLCKNKCPSYTQTGLDELHCAKCSCGASAHKLLSLDETDTIGFSSSIKNDIFPKLNQSMVDSQLHFNCFLVLYKIIDKNANKNQFSWLFQLFREGGFKIHLVEIKTLKDDNGKGLINNLDENLNSFYNSKQKEKNETPSLNKYNLEKSLLEKSHYNKKDTTFKTLSKIDNKFKFLTTQNNNNDIGNNNNGTGNNVKDSLKSTIRLNEDLRGTNLYQSFMTQNMKSIIYEKVPINTKLYEEFSNPILAICLSIDTDNHFNYFEKFNYAINHSNTVIRNLTTSLKLLYYSRSKTAALWDIQVLFPELFRINKLCQLITSKPNYPSEYNKAISLYNDSLKANSFHVIDNFSYATFAELKSNHPFFPYSESDTTVTSALYQLNYVGDSNTIHMASMFGFNPYLNIMNFSLDKDYHMMTNEFFQNTIQYERVLVIFRPFILRNGLNEVLLNIFRINNFQILTRKTAVLTKDQISFLYMKEFTSNLKIEYEDYEHMMTDANCEIIVLSKFSAIKDVNTLLGFNEKEINVNLYNSLKSSLSFPQMQIDYELTNKVIQKTNVIPKEDLIEQFHPIKPQKIQSCFKDIASLLNVDSIMTAISKEKQKLNVNNLYSEIQSIKTHLLKIASYFNLFAYHTKEFPSTQEDVNYFFPHFGEMEEALMIVKDYFKAKETLERMKYEIVDYKAIRLSQEQFEGLFDEYLSNELVTPHDYSKCKEYTMNTDICLLRVVKPGAFYELKKIVGKENYFFLLSNNNKIYTNSSINNRNSSQFNSTDYISQLKQTAYLIDNSINIEYYYSILNDKIKIIEGGNLDSTQRINLNQILNSCLKCTIGENLRFDNRASIRDVQLIERYLYFYHFDLNEREKEYFITALNKLMFPKYSQEDKPGSIIESKFFEVISNGKYVLNSQMSFFIESTALGFYEVRIPVLERMTSEGWLYLDMKDLIIKRNYLYTDTPFYQELIAKNKNDKILYSFFPYEKGSLSSFLNFKTTSDTIAKSLIGFNSVAFDRANLNLLKASFDFTDNEAEIQRRILYTTKYESTKMFYKACIYDNQTYHIVPKNYHYRIKPDDIYMNISRIYEVEEFGGLNFIEVVIQDYMKYRLPEQNIKIEKGEVLSYTNPYNTWYGQDKDQFSLPAYLWGRKLMNLCFCVENMGKCNTDNYGPVIYFPKTQKIAGIINSDNIKEYEMYLYMNIIEDIRQFGFDFLSEKDIDMIERKIVEAFNSQIFNSTRIIENARLMPCRITETNLRINKNKPVDMNNNSINNNNESIIDKDEKNKQHRLASSINPNHEMQFHSLFKKKEENEFDTIRNSLIDIKTSNNSIDNNTVFINNNSSILPTDFLNQENKPMTKDILSKNIILIDIFCYIGMKYHMYASILFLLRVFFRKISRKSNLITLPSSDPSKSNIEYDKLLDAMLEGFKSHSHINYSAFNDSERYNAYNIEYFFYCLREVKYHMNEIELLNEKLAKCDELLHLKDNEAQDNDEYIELSTLHEEMAKSLKEHINNIEIIMTEAKDCRLQQTVEDLDNYKYKYAPKERYHIPMYMKEKWERNMDNPKYIQTEKIPSQLLTNLNTIQEKEKREIYTSTGFEVKNDFYLVQKSLLREPQPEPEKLILLSKKKNEKKEGISNKIFSNLVKQQIDNDIEEEMKRKEGNKGDQSKLTYEDYLRYLEGKPQFKIKSTK